MIRRTIWVMGFAFLNVACAPVGSGGALNNLPDVDNDGFGELSVPAGVDTSEVIEVRLANTITRGQIEELFGDSLPPGSELATITIEESITRVYDNGSRVTESGSQPLGMFDLAFEAPCPEQVIVSVDVSASVPLIGNVFQQEVATVTGTQDGSTGDFILECDMSIQVEAFLNDDGQPDVEFNVEPL